MEGPFSYYWTGDAGSSGMKGEGGGEHGMMEGQPSHTAGRCQASRSQVLLWAVRDLRSLGESSGCLLPVSMEPGAEPHLWLVVGKP